MTDQTQEIHMQVMWNRLISVVEEQAMTLLRTAFSTSVREAGDLSAGVFDPQGRMLAQAVTGTPGHVNTMAEAVLHFIAEIGRRFRLDLALLPVATFRLPMTMGDRGAVAAVAELGAATVIPIHLGIAPRSPLLRTAQSADSFARRLRDSGSATRVVHLREGESWDGAAPVTNPNLPKTAAASGPHSQATTARAASRLGRERKAARA